MICHFITSRYIFRNTIHLKIFYFFLNNWNFHLIIKNGWKLFFNLLKVGRNSNSILILLTFFEIINIFKVQINLLIIVNLNERIIFIKNFFLVIDIFIVIIEIAFFVFIFIFILLFLRFICIYFINFWHF